MKIVFLFCFRLVEFFFISLITYYFTIQWNIHSMFHSMECIIYFAYAYNSRQCYKVAIIATWLSNWKDIKKATYIHTHTHIEHTTHYSEFIVTLKILFFSMQHHKWMWIVIVVAYPLFNVFVLYVRLFAALSTKMMWCHQSFPSWIPTYLMNVCIHFFHGLSTIMMC